MHKRIIAFKVSKTDTIDAPMLAPFAAKSYGLRRRDDLTKFMRIEQNHLEHETIKTVRLSRQRHVRYMSEMDGLNKQIAALVAATPAFKRKAELIQSIKGIGPNAASACLAYLPELGSLTKDEAVAIVGLAPYAKVSGTDQGHRVQADSTRKTIKSESYSDHAWLIVLMNTALKEGQASDS